jgi:hypothetical protein
MMRWTADHLPCPHTVEILRVEISCEGLQTRSATWGVLIGAMLRRSLGPFRAYFLNYAQNGGPLFAGVYAVHNLREKVEVEWLSLGMPA